jgi:hypothetical protein
MERFLGMDRTVSGSKKRTLNSRSLQDQEKLRTELRDSSDCEARKQKRHERILSDKE